MPSSNSVILFLLTLTLSLTISSSALTQSPPPIPIQSPPSVPPSITNACEALTNSGRLYMSLLLELIAPDLNLRSPTILTVFAPPNSVFVENGQPSWATLSLHFSRLVVSTYLLRSSTTIPCFTPKKRLIINSYTVNGVSVTQTPIFDDGRVVVYGIDRFLDPDYKSNDSTVSVRNPDDFKCLERTEEGSIFDEAVGVMEARGHSIMASFLKLQVFEYMYDSRKSNVGMTVFAPVNEDLVKVSGGFLDFAPILKKHVLACKVGINDVNGLSNGTVIANYEGDGLQFTEDEDGEIRIVNGVEIVAPGMYESDWLVIHGIGGLIPLTAVENES